MTTDMTSEKNPKYTDAIQVACPRCHAKANAKCVRMNAASYKPGTEMGVCHAARYTAAGVSILYDGPQGERSRARDNALYLAQKFDIVPFHFSEKYGQMIAVAVDGNGLVTYRSF